MNHKQASKLCKLGIAIGAIAIVFGVIPFAIGLYSINLNDVKVSQESLADLKVKPGGDALASCALRIAALSAEGNTALRSVIHISRSQSFALLISGVSVMIIFIFLFRFISQNVRVQE